MVDDRGQKILRRPEPTASWSDWNEFGTVEPPRDVFWARISCGVAISAVLIMLVIAFGVHPISATVVVIVVIPALILVGCAGLWLWIRRGAILIPAKTKQLLRRGLCPCCAFELGTIQHEADGCTVCPECGAAWRLDTPDA